MTQIKRSQGRSVVAAAAYRAAECLTSEYDGIVSDFTRKRGVLHSEILLPSHAPPEFVDRGTLWNAVEKIEKRKNAQLAHSFDIALQSEFSFEENLALVRRFLQENFISRGMIVDFSIHDPDNGNGIRNPHFHVLCPIRPLNSDGTWGQKQHKETGEDGHEKFVSNTDWGDKQTLMGWRQAWADINNAKFAEKGLPQRIDCRSYEEQGLQLIPTVHEGPAVREMEARGIRTNKGSLNRWIRRVNEFLKRSKERLAELKKWFAEHRAAIREPDNSLLTLVGEYYNDRTLLSMARGYKPSRRESLEHTQLIVYLSEHHLWEIDQLTERIDELQGRIGNLQEKVKSCETAGKKIDSTVRYIKMYRENRAVAKEYGEIRFKKRREKFFAEHEPKLKKFRLAKRKLQQRFGEGFSITPEMMTDFRRQREELESERRELDDQIAPLREELRELMQVRYKVERAIKLREETEEERRKRYERAGKKRDVRGM